MNGLVDKARSTSHPYLCSSSLYLSSTLFPRRVIFFPNNMPSGGEIVSIEISSATLYTLRSGLDKGSE